MITLEEVNGKASNIRMFEASEHGNAVLTHYLQNHKNGVSCFYKKEALNHVKKALEHKFPEDNITSKVAEKALQYMIFDFQKNIPFPAPTKPKFKFIDLFAGIGGFRIAMQNLGGKCVYTSEWNKEAQKTYRANYGEIPFGDITKERVKNYIPNNFDILCGGFPCQAFSIAGYRKGFSDTRGTLFFDVEQIKLVA